MHWMPKLMSDVRPGSCEWTHCKLKPLEELAFPTPSGNRDTIPESTGWLTIESSEAPSSERAGALHWPPQNPAPVGGSCGPTPASTAHEGLIIGSEGLALDPDDPH